MKTKRAELIKKFWNKQAEYWKFDIRASTPDILAKKLEIKILLEYLKSYKNNKNIIDIGCGNGYTTIQLAKKVNAKLVGIDFSKQMIEIAKKSLPLNLRTRVKFKVEDVRNINFKNEVFDIAITDRCITNMTSQNEQLLALKEIWRILKKQGIYLMLENSIQGLNNLNRLRKQIKLYPIKKPWHNIYIDENFIFPKIAKFFTLEKVDNFASTYYIASRVFNAALTPPGSEPNYLAPINKISLKLESIGDFGHLKLFVLKKL